MKRATLSVIVVAMNEAHDIGDCLESVRHWADEVIVLDSGSTDGTPALCRQLGALVFETDWPGDGPQKNRALAQARSDWVLCLDADERVSPELHAEIESVLTRDTAHVAFSTPRRSSFCGRFMKHSGWWPDRVDRLFKRGHARFSDRHVHPSLIIDGTKGKLNRPIIHFSIPNLHEALDKVNAYSSTGAQIFFEQGRRASLRQAIGHGLWAFIRTYWVRLGFLDGKEGFLLAVANAESSYYRYVKLMLMQQQDDKNNSR